MPGPLPTPPDRRARTNSPSSGVWSPPAQPLCEPPEGLLEETLADWHDFWRQPIAGGVTRSDLPALIRLFRIRNEATQCREEACREPLVAGSQGQLVQNPLARHAKALEADIRALEEHFGLTPKARLRLNVVLADAAEGVERTAAALARSGGAGGAEETDRADPRLADTGPTAAVVRAGGGQLG